MHARPTLGSPPDLTIPEEGSRTARVVLGLALRHLLADLRKHRLGPDISDPVRAAYRQLREVLAEIGATHPGAAPSLLRRPTIGAPLRCLRDRRLPPEPLAIELVSQCFFELALHGALPRPITIGLAPPVLIGLSHGVYVRVPEGVEEISFEGGHVSIGGERFPLTPGGRVESLPALGEHAFLGLVDNNPLSFMEAHPDKGGNAVDLGGQSVERWTGALNEAFALVRSVLPDLAAEMELYVQLVVPIGFDEERHLSASYQEAIGTLYLSLHPDPMTMAEALIHEFSHGKLNALLELDPVLENAFSAFHVSPIRPDPRPLHGVLLAAHAFFPVAMLYERMLAADHPLASSPDFRRRFSQVREIVSEAAAVLRDQARPTAIGTGVHQEILKWDEHFRNGSMSNVVAG